MFAIEAQHLSKVYRIYANPKDRLKEFLTRSRRTYHQEFWALRDVGLQVPTGSTLGLIGENGAGKSTLLQLVAGVLRPTSGQVTTRGRVSTILELGTGFNPEFTGRENAMMSGIILGIPSREMERLLPAIEDFAEIGDFFDRPVKIYSSGMYVRLAFAVVTSVDPDVLIVDEALSVGDQHFQKRCIDRIERFRKSGKTILFCSHSLYLVHMICDRAIWLHQGKVAEAGDVSRVVAAYETYLRERELRMAPAAASDDGPKAFPWIAEVRLSRGEEDAPQDTFITGEELTVTVHYEVPQSPTVVHVGVSIERNDAVEVFATATHLADVRPASASGSVRLRFPRLALMSGAYALSVFLLDEHGLHVYDRRVRTCTFFVEQLVQQLGLCYLEHQWEAGVAATDGPQPFLQREPARL